MNLYLITWPEQDDYDQWDSAVVAAENENAARETHPSGHAWPERPRKYGASWAPTPEGVDVQLIGVATEPRTAGVICASFNAG